MTTVLDVARAALAVYTLGQAPGWRLTQTRRSSQGIVEGLQAGVYTREGGGTAIAFRGTNLAVATPVGSVQDVLADLTLGTGGNSYYFSAAEDFVAPYVARGDVVVCGHSLGGAIAQVVGNRTGLRFVTFNAPGVAVVASRNMGDASRIMTGVRIAGMLGSAVSHPFQAVSDMRYAFRTVRGLNVRIQGDPVSAIGVHYGDVVRIPAVAQVSGESSHSMSLAVRSLEADPLGARDVTSIN